MKRIIPFLMTLFLLMQLVTVETFAMITSPKKPIEEGVYTIETRLKSDMVMDIDNRNDFPRAANLYSKVVGSRNQQFIVKYNSKEDSYTITDLCFGKPLGVSADNCEQGSRITGQEEFGPNFYNWKLQLAEDGYYFLQLQSSDLVLDVQGGKFDPLTPFQLWKKNFTDAQKIKFIPISQDILDRQFEEELQKMKEATVKTAELEIDDLRKQGKEMPAGIFNYGNSCFLNASIQQLYNIQSFREEILRVVVDEGNQPIIFNLQIIFRAIQINVSAKRDPNIENAVREIRKRLFNGNSTSPQDASEFIGALIDRIREENHDMDKYIGGFFSHQAKSSGCQNPSCSLLCSRREEMFNVCPLSIESLVNLSDILDNTFNREEKMDDFRCEECGSIIKCTKKTEIKDLYDNVIFQFMRFNLAAGVGAKINKKIEFPEEIDLGKYTVEKISSIYKLSGVIVHSGNLNGGHYYSFVLIDDRWYRVNDSDVSLVTFGNIRESFGDGKSTSNAYILRYTKK